MSETATKNNTKDIYEFQCAVLARIFDHARIFRGQIDLIIGTARVIAKSLTETTSNRPRSFPFIPSRLLTFVSRPQWPRGHRPTLLRFLLGGKRLLRVWQRTLTFTTCIVLNHLQHEFIFLINDDKIEKTVM